MNVKPNTHSLTHANERKTKKKVYLPFNVTITQNVNNYISNITAYNCDK